MKNNDLRAIIAQEVTRAQLIEALKAGTKGGAIQDASADNIIDDYTVLVRGLSVKAGISLKESNKIVTESLRNGGELIKSEALDTLSEGWLRGLSNAIGNFYIGIGKVFTGEGAKEVPKENDVLAALQRAQQGEQVMQLLRQMLGGVKAADEAEDDGNPEDEAAEDKVVDGLEDAIEDIDDQLPDGDLPPPEGEAGEGAEAGADAGKPLSIMKKQKTGDPNKPAEVPLVTYLQKQLKFGAKASQKIARNLSKQLSAAGVQVAESRILELYQEALLEATMNDLKAIQEAGRPRSKSRKEQEAEKEAGRKTRRDRVADVDSAESDLADAEARKAATAGGSSPYTSNPFADSDVRDAQSKVAGAKDGVEAAGASLGATVQGHKDARAADKADRKEMEKRAKSHPGGAVAQTVLTHAARTASRPGQYDEEFMTALGEDPKAQDKKINSIVKLLRRQMQRRGMDDAIIKKALRLKEAQVAEMIMRKLEEDFIRNREAQK